MMGKFFAILAFAVSFSAFAAPDCQKTDSVCTAPNQTRNVSGLSIFRECWEYQDVYQCRSQVMINDCQPLRDKGCVQLGSSCVERNNNTNDCVMYEQKYNCPDKPETYTERTVCDQSAFCQNNGMGCFDTSSPPDNEFGKAVVMMEAAREAGVYGIDRPNKVNIFKGYMEECGIKVLGGATIKNCCKSAGGGGAFTNHVLLGAAVDTGLKVAKMGSKYVYDALFSQVDSSLLDKGLSAVSGQASNLGSGVFNPQFGLYGFTFEFTFANGFQFVGFDPYSFAISIAVALVQEWLACDPDERTIAKKRGQNLCVHVETYCDRRIFGICIEKKERHCCFNSKLAKIINRQGRTQLAMPMNSCDGFNQEQLQSLDFSRMDLSEFIADIVPKDVPASAMSDRVRQSVDQKVQNYYSQ